MDKPTPQDIVLSCGHGGRGPTALAYEKLDEPVAPPLRLGKLAPIPATWRVACAACIAAAGQFAPRMVWIGPFSDVDKGYMGARGVLL